MIPRSGGPLGDGHGDRRPAEAGEGHQGQVLGAEVRVVEQAQQEVGGPTGDAEPFVAHQAQDVGRVPLVDQVDGPLAQQRYEEGVDHADEMTDRRPGDLRAGPRRGTCGRAGGPRNRWCGGSAPRPSGHASCPR